jgi:hypothetical protein
LRQGRASSVVDLGTGRVLRTGGRPEAEAEMMVLARDHGLRVPVVHEVRPDGLVMELVEGPTLLEQLRRRPWTMQSGARIVADLHRQLHEVRYRDGRLVHFDLHPENVIVGPDGPVLIDWTNGHAGDPDADVAMTWLIAMTSGGIGGRIFGWLFRRLVGAEAIRRGLPAARTFRLRDPHVTDAERARVSRLRA